MHTVWRLSLIALILHILLLVWQEIGTAMTLQTCLSLMHAKASVLNPNPSSTQVS